MPREIVGVKLYNLEEAAELMGVSYATIRNYRRDGKITGQRVGRAVMITEEEIQRFVRGGARNGAEGVK